MEKNLEKKHVFNFFNDNDFKRCKPSCSIQDMNYYFLRDLDNARWKTTVPFIINSAYRSKDYELKKGRSGTSSHTKGLAVDIRVKNDSERYEILRALIITGFKRIGVYKKFIHVDSDLNKKQNIIWFNN